MDKKFARSAVGAFALCVALAWPMAGAQAAQRAEPAAAVTAIRRRSRCSAATSARASACGYRHGGYRGRGYGGRGYYGGNGALIGAGAAALILGGAAAAAASSQRERWIEPRWVEDPYGPEPRRVRVC
ncbi:MAG: hypothetical protein ACRCVA_33750 [Phreatobacter sp.]